MKKLIKNLIIFAAGAGVGAGVTYVVTKTKFTQQAQEDINAMREYYSSKNTQNAENEAPTASQGHSESEEEEKTHVSKVEREHNKVDRPEHIDYTSFFNKPPLVAPTEDNTTSETSNPELDEDDEDAEYGEDEFVDIDDEDYDPEKDGRYYEEIVTPQKRHKMLKPKPYSISPDEYAESNSFEKRDLTYFAGDNTLVDEDEVIVNNSFANIPELLPMFGEYEKDILYVRNEQYAIDFAIEYTPGSFAKYSGVVD